MSPRETFRSFLPAESSDEYDYAIEGLPCFAVSRKMGTFFDAAKVTVVAIGIVGMIALSFKEVVEKFKEFVSGFTSAKGESQSSPVPPNVQMPADTHLTMSKSIESPSYLQAPKNAADYISEASSATGVSKALLLSFANQESSFDVDATNKKTGAYGLFQLTGPTWKDMVKKYGTKFGFTEAARRNPRAAAIMGAFYIRDLSDSLKRYLGSDPSVTDIYAAHVLGPSGVRRLLDAAKKNPNARADTILGKAAEYNANLFYADGERKKQPFTVSQVYSKLYSKVGAQYTKFASGDTSSPRMPEFSPQFTSVGESQQAAPMNVALAATTKAADSVYSAPKQETIQYPAPGGSSEKAATPPMQGSPKKQENIAGYGRSRSGILIAYPA